MEVTNMKWIKAILDKHVREDGTLDIEAANAEINAEFAKHAVPKATFNEKLEDIKTLKTDIKALKEDNGSAATIEALQKKVKEYEEKEAQQTKETAIKEALQKAGATDIDYMMFKLGDVDVSEDGTIPFLEQQVNDLKGNFPKYFEEKNDDGKGDGNEGGDGYKPIDNKLPGGNPPKENLDDDFISAFTADLPQ